MSKHWFVLRTPPQLEFQAIAGLIRRGYQAFVPTEIRKRKVSRYSKATREVKYPLTPRYVFAGFEQSTPPWQDLDQIDAVQSVVSFNGQPARLSRVTVDHLRDLKPPADYQPYTGPKIGQMANILDGAFKGWKGPVTGIAKGQASITLPMFGTDRTVEIPLEILRPG